MLRCFWHATACCHRRQSARPGGVAECLAQRGQNGGAPEPSRAMQEQADLLPGFMEFKARNPELQHLEAGIFVLPQRTPAHGLQVLDQRLHALVLWHHGACIPALEEGGRR